ncbi:MAG: hypothetical protein NW223_23665 [Hyphomicrobiaceae bacterium]|nr:hypothetical protein [Hyphomicrobiaceae bacterium]
MSNLRDICHLIEARAAAEDDAFVQLGEANALRHAEAFWQHAERLASTPAQSIEDLLMKAQAAALIWRHQRIGGEPLYELLRDLVAEFSTIEERVAFSLLADAAALSKLSRAA